MKKDESQKPTRWPIKIEKGGGRLAHALFSVLARKMSNQKGKNDQSTKHRDETPPKVSDRTPQCGDESCHGIR